MDHQLDSCRAWAVSDSRVWLGEPAWQVQDARCTTGGRLLAERTSLVTALMPRARSGTKANVLHKHTNPHDRAAVLAVGQCGRKCHDSALLRRKEVRVHHLSAITCNGDAVALGVHLRQTLAGTSADAPNPTGSTFRMGCACKLDRRRNILFA